MRCKFRKVQKSYRERYTLGYFNGQEDVKISNAYVGLGRNSRSANKMLTVSVGMEQLHIKDTRSEGKREKNELSKENMTKNSGRRE